MRRIPRTLAYDNAVARLMQLSGRQVPVDLEARLNANGIFINKLINKD